MTDASDGKRHFFVSYTKADRAWAEWVGAMLEQAGYTVLLEVWDVKSNFVAHMHGAETRAERTVALLSDNYFRSDFTLGEWTVRYACDPAMREDRLIPVVVGPVSRANLLDPILHADLFACGRDEVRARETLLERIARATDPAYGAKRRAQHYAFPGRAEAASQPPAATPPRFPVPLHNLPPQNPDFVGREDVLARLHELLSQGQGPAVLTQAITGLSGIGKTQTALAYCYQHLSEYTVIWWLHAEQTATLAGQLGALAPHLGLDPAMPDQAALATLVCDALARRGGFLLVFDSLEQPEVLPAFLPRTGGTVLITAQQRDWHGRAKTLSLEVMTEPEAVRLLTGAGEGSALPEQRQEQAAALAMELGHLPLALAQARDYVAATGETVAGYQALLVASRPTVLAGGHAHPDDPATVARTWEVSIRAAEKESPAARELLELLAFFAPEPLPRHVLAAAPDTLPEPLRDPLARNRALAALTRFSLVIATQGSLTVHRLVQAVTRDGLGPDRAAARAECAVRLAAVGWPSHLWDHKGWSAVQAVLPHALAAAQAAARHTPAVAITGDVLDRVATYFQVRGAYGEATPLFEQAIAIGEKTLGPEHPDLAVRLNNLANLYSDTGRSAEAEPLFQRVLAIGEKTLGPEHRNLGTRLNNLANLYQATGRYAEAEPLFQRALEIYEKALGEEHPFLAIGLNNLANLYQATGRYAEAEPLFQRALVVSEKILGQDHPVLATWLNNLALLYQATGRYAEAEPLFQRALAIGEKTIDPEHPDLAIWLNNLASFYRATGRYAETEPLFQRALAIDEKVLGSEHPGLAADLNNLALLYQATGRYVEAEPLFQRALAIDEKVLGPEHPSLAIRLNNLASLYRATGRYAEAEPLFQHALAIDEKTIGPDHPSLGIRLNNLALLYRATGRSAEAEPLFQRALAMGEKTLGPDHPSLATRLNNLANLYSATGRYAEAEPLFQRALEIYEKALGEENPFVATGLNNLARLYRVTGRYAEAEPLFQRALAIDEKVLSPEHPDLATDLNNFALLYQATGRYAEAEPLFQRSIAILEKALPPDHPHLRRGRENYAHLLDQLGRPAKAAALRAPAQAIRSRREPG